MKGRIVHITLSMDAGGIESLILNLASFIDRDRFSLQVDCLDRAGVWFDRLREIGCNGFVFQRKPGFDARLIFRLIQRFRRHPCDLVHTHNQAAHFYGGLAAKLAGVPCLVATEHSRHFIDERYRRRVEKRVMARITDRFITVSDELAARAKEREKLPTEKISVICNGIDVRRFSKPRGCELGAVEARKRTLGIGAGEKIILAVGRLHAVKNQRLLLEAARSLVDTRGLSPHFLLAGDGPSRDELQKLAAFLGLEGRVHFLGVRQDIPELLWMSDAFVLCSLSEGLPLSLLEAWAAEIPVLITRSANRAALIQDQINGKVVDDDVQSLAEGVASLLFDPVRSQRWSERGLMEVQRKYSIHAMTGEYEALYESLLKKKVWIERA